MLKQHKEKLRNNHVQLVNEMNGESIIHELYQKKFISQIAMESLLSYRTRTEQNSHLLHSLPKMGPDVFEKFCDSLSNSGNHSLKRLLTGDENMQVEATTHPTLTSIKKIIRKNCVKIVKTVDTPMILLACLQVELIDELTMDSIYSNGKTDLKRNFILLQYLLKRTCNKDLLSKLIEAFRLADYQELARDLQTEPLFD